MEVLFVLVAENENGAGAGADAAGGGEENRGDAPGRGAKTRWDDEVDWTDKLVAVGRGGADKEYF